MKIAICLSGQPRTPEIGYKFIKKYLIDPNSEHKIDFFLHAWYDANDVGKAWDSAQPYEYGKNGFIKEGTDKFLLEKFSPIKYTIEPQINFEEYTANFNSHFTAKQNVLASIFYSMNASNKHKLQFEKEQNFEYDLVVRTRYDLAYMKPIIFSEHLHNINKIVVPAKFQRDQDNFNNPNKPMVDIFAFSNSKNMDIFCNVYPNLKKLNSIVNPPFGENYLGQWVRNENQVEICLADFEMQILHRMINMRDY